MAIELINENTGVDTGSGFTVTRSETGSPANGDYLVLIMATEDDSPAVVENTTTLWTQGELTVQTSGLYDCQMSIWWRKITDINTEPTTYNFTAGSNDNTAWWVGTLRGIDQGTPEDVTFSGTAASTGATDTSIDAAAINTVTDGAFVFAICATNYDADINVPGSPWETRTEDLVTGIINLSIVSKTQANHGDTGAATFSGLTASRGAITAQYAFRPATAVGTNMKINIGDAWKDVTGLQINIGDSWKTVTKVEVNIGGSWKTVFSA